MERKICSDECPCCIYICEGDYFCDAIGEIVIEDWFPVVRNCPVEDE